MATCMLEKHSPNCSIHNPPPILLFKSVFACISLVPTAVQVRKAAEDITEEASGIQIKTERLHKSVGSEGGGGASWGLFLFSADLSPSESDLPPPCKSSECRILGPLLKPLVPCHSPPLIPQSTGKQPWYEVYTIRSTQAKCSQLPFLCAVARNTWQVLQPAHCAHFINYTGFSALPNLAPAIGASGSIVMKQL